MMKIKDRLLVLIFAMCIACGVSITIAAQSGGTAPREEKLLNGLKVLMWSTTSDKATVRIRVHAGSSFDPQGKEGVMSLLADSIFPTKEARDYFSEDLEGSISISCEYDYIQIDATGKGSEFLAMLDTLATAVAAPTIDKETTEALKASLLAQVNEAEKDPSYTADMAVIKQLFGTFPYGRPRMGTPDSIAKIDFADLRFAKDRLFTADNATVTISAPVKSDLMFRAIRRYLGAWNKADQKIPATFRQPDAPATALKVIDIAPANASEFRIAMRGPARSDADFFAAKILQKIIERRFTSKAGVSARSVFDQRLLPGVYIFGTPGAIPGKDSAVETAVHLTTAFRSAIESEITPAEFDTVNNLWVKALNPANSDILWLDIDTFKLDSVAKQTAAAASVKLPDVQRLLEKMRKEPAASVLIYGK